MQDGVSTNTRTIVVADDDVACVRLLERQLGAAGYTVLPCFNGTAALAHVMGQGPAVLLADWDMPGLTGVQLCERIRASEQGDAVYIILLTGYAQRRRVVTGLESGADDYLVKPYDREELLARIRAGDRILRLIQQLRADEQQLKTSNAALAAARQKAEQSLEEVKQAHVQVLQAEKMIAIGQLAAGIAHEINTPTQFVGDNIRFLRQAFADLKVLLDNYAELHALARRGQVTPKVVAEVEAAITVAELDYLSEEIPKAIQQSLDGVQRVATIVRAMKEFSHPADEEPKAVDLNRAIESTITVARNEWKYVADVVTQLDPNLPPVPCSAGDINQVILNILVNAAHAIADSVGDGSGGKGTITVSTRCDGDWVEVRIKDTGTGIPEKVQSRVFEPFFTTKEVGKGTGQGLAIARSVIVEKHGGTIAFETEAGVGTTFIVRLPLSTPSPDKGAALEQATHPDC
jgi:signal transduction histidine kinase